MKIISCHIENFGKLHDYSVSFTDGMNIFCAENGWGKSTFAAFVRAMFYGLDGERKRSIEENERKRYMPWQGGVFGGQLVFETEGKEYQISRIFHDKDVNDVFELRDAKTNLLSKDYSKKIGEEIFKIDRESFIRTIFIGQNGCETSATDDINAKIGNLTENSNDLNNFDSAHARLTEIINGLNPGRVTGSVSKRREEIGRLERIVMDGRGISESIDSYQEYLHAEEDAYEILKVKMNETGELQAKVSGLQTMIAKKSEWERLKNSVLSKKEEVASCKIKLPGEIPELDEVKKKIVECGNMEKASERMSMYHIPQAEEAELAELDVVFAEGIPTDEELDAKLAEAGKFRIISQEYSAEQMSPAEKQRLDELEPYFSKESTNVTAIVGKWNNRNTKKATIPSNQAALTALRASMAAQRPKSKISLLTIVGIVLAVIGVIGVIADYLMVGCIIAGIGLVLMIVGLVLGKRRTDNMQPEVSPEMESLMQTIEEDMAYIERVDEEVADYLAEHGRDFDEYAVSTLLQEIAAEAVEYSSLKKKELQEKASTKVEELEDLRQSISDFLQRYRVYPKDTSFSDDLYALKAKANRYLILSDRESRFKEAEAAYKASYESISTYLIKHGYAPADSFLVQLNSIREDVDDYQDALKVFEEAKKVLDGFEAETDISMLEEVQVEADLPSLEELNQTIMRLTEEMEKVHSTILSYNKSLENLQEKYDEWEECQIKLKELKELQIVEQNKYNHILKARLKLCLAKEALTAKYADPILKSFSQYFEMITGNAADNFHVDANTAVTVDEMGKQRETNTLSAGYRDLVGICLRIALIDAMYQEEAPVIVMDDPFTNMDDSKIHAGKEFLKKIAEKYQIIYFTCSNSRR